jgi:hypothetical protein
MMLSQEAAYHEIYRLHRAKILSRLCVEEVVAGERTEPPEQTYRAIFSPIIVSTVSHYLRDHPVAILSAQRDKIYAEPVLTTQALHTLTSEIDPLLKLYVEQFKYAAGAKTLLASTTSIQLCAASTRQTFDAAFSPAAVAIERKPQSQRTTEEQAYLHKVVMMDREEAAVERAAAEGDKVIAVQYGALHFPLQAIVKWNSAHPASQLGLVFVPDAAMKGMPPVENPYAAPK